MLGKNTRQQSSSGITETGTQNVTESRLRYENPSERLASYKGKEVAVNPEEASEAGLYHTGEDDILQCFKCDLKLKNWKAHDDPMREHASHSRDCQYVIQKMGDDYVKSACRQVQANIEHKLVEKYNLMKIERDELMAQCNELWEQNKKLRSENKPETLDLARSPAAEEEISRSGNTDPVTHQHQVDVAREDVAASAHNVQRTSGGHVILQETDSSHVPHEVVTSASKPSKAVAKGFYLTSNKAVQTDLTLLESYNQPGHEENGAAIDEAIEGEAAEGGVAVEEDINDQNVSIAQQSCKEFFSEDKVAKAVETLEKED